MKGRVNFKDINTVALRALPLILSRWLPDGKRLGREFVARNPTRADRTAGSFRINVITGKWADFATARISTLHARAYLSANGLNGGYDA